jgi:hypothetical protein
MSSSAHEKVVLARERLRLLAYGYYIHGGFNALMFSLFAIPFFIMMIAFAAIPESQWSKHSPPSATGVTALASPAPPRAATQEQPPKLFFAIFGAVFGTIVLGNLAVCALTIYAGRCMQKRTRKTLIYAMAIVNCIFVPYGTLLGVFTIMVMGSPEAKAEFTALPA